MSGCDAPTSQWVNMSDIQPINIRAEFSSDRKYRYLWEAEINNPSGNGKPVTFLMLNPSCADEIVTDPTIDRCLTYVDRWRYSALRVVNLFAYRTPKPECLPRDYSTAAGPYNDCAILDAVVDAPLTICAWGNGGKASKLLEKRVTEVRKLLKRYRKQLNLKCLELNNKGLGEPKHPGRHKKEVALDELRPYDPWSPA